MTRKNCSINLIYKLPECTVIGDRTVFEIRYRLGEKLAESAMRDGVKMNFDMVVPVPNTGKTYAKGFADKTGINYIELLNKIEDMRTCYMKDLDVRKSLIEKLINITDNDISGRSICLIDEAIFTGTTLKSVCDTLRRKQVGKITLMIPTPPCVGNCRYHELSSENMLLKNHSIEEACLYLGADRLRYQCKNDFESIISGTGITCKECFANKKNTERNTEYKINAHQA